MKIDAEGVLSLLSFGIRRIKPTVSETIPGVQDLEARVEALRASEPVEEIPAAQQPSVAGAASGKATSIASGCIPCSIGHLGTCSGLLNEAMRFARKDGIQSDEVISRVNMCVDELNALERVDLRPEMTYDLPEWEKPLAESALDLSRSLRHDLEGILSVSALEEISARTQTKRQEIGKTWFKERFSRLPPDQQKVVETKLKERAAAAG